MKVLLALLLLIPWTASSAVRGFCNGWDNGAKNWRAQVAVQSGTLSARSFQNGLQFMLHARQWGMRSVLTRVNLYLGDDKNALEAVIIHDFWDSTDTISGKATFTYSETGGLAGQFNAGLSGGVTWIGFNMAIGDVNTNSFHVGLYNLTASNEGSIAAGGSSAIFNPIMRLDIANGGTTQGALFDNGSKPGFSDSNGVGWYVISRESASALHIDKNGVSQASNSSAPSDVTGMGGLIFHALNNAGNVGFNTSRAQAGYTMGLGVNATQSALLYKLMQHVQINALRAVGSHAL